MGQWTLTVLACPLTVITLALAVQFLDPADGTSLPHDLGARALSFSLHLLVLLIVALGLGLLAWRLRAQLAASVFVLVVILSSFLALWPSIAMWQLASKENVPLSLGTYLAYAAHRDNGGRRLSGRSYMVRQLTARSWCWISGFPTWLPRARRRRPL